MSVMNPGVIRKAPPKITRPPSSASRAGARPAASASLKRRQAARPSDRRSIEPTTESAIRIPIVHHTPIAPPTWMITNSSAIGRTMKIRTRRATNIAPRRVGPPPRRAACLAGDAARPGLTPLADGHRRRLRRRRDGVARPKQAPAVDLLEEGPIGLELDFRLGRAGRGEPVLVGVQQEQVLHADHPFGRAGADRIRGD